METLFLSKNPNTLEDSFLFGLGLGLYWGEGNKKNKTSVRLGNTNPRLVKRFIEFLQHTYGARKEKFRFSLQIFSDMNPKEALRFWVNALQVSPQQFGKVIVTPSRGLGTYREKTQHGVVTVYFSNTRLRDLLCAEIERL